MDFEACYEQYFEKIYRYIFYMTSEKQLAEDLTQEAFLRLYKSTFSGQAEMYTYVRQIARNLVYDHYRRKALIKWLPFQKKHEPQQHGAEELLLQQEERKKLYEALQQLKPAHREVIIYRKIEALSLDETAKILGRTVVQIANTQRTAMKALARILGGEADEA